MTSPLTVELDPISSSSTDSLSPYTKGVKSNYCLNFTKFSQFEFDSVRLRQTASDHLIHKCLPSLPSRELESHICLIFLCFVISPADYCSCQCLITVYRLRPNSPLTNAMKVTFDTALVNRSAIICLVSMYTTSIFRSLTNSRTK